MFFFIKERGGIKAFTLNNFHLQRSNDSETYTGISQKTAKKVNNILLITCSICCIQKLILSKRKKSDMLKIVPLVFAVGL